jgi:hypothetical protein
MIKNSFERERDLFVADMHTIEDKQQACKRDIATVQKAQEELWHIVRQTHSRWNGSPGGCDGSVRESLEQQKLDNVQIIDRLCQNKEEELKQVEKDLARQREACEERYRRQLREWEKDTR